MTRIIYYSQSQSIERENTRSVSRRATPAGPFVRETSDKAPIPDYAEKNRSLILIEESLHRQKRVRVRTSHSLE